jgi:hypothetical protein
MIPGDKGVVTDSAVPPTPDEAGAEAGAEGGAEGGGGRGKAVGGGGRWMDVCARHCPEPNARGLHSSTSQLNVSTVCGMRWVPLLDRWVITRHTLDK